MWPFRKKPHELKFKVGDPVFFRILDGGRLYAGTVKAANPNESHPYVCSPDLLPNEYAEISESLIRSRDPTTASKGCPYAEDGSYCGYECTGPCPCRQPQKGDDHG